MGGQQGRRFNVSWLFNKIEVFITSRNVFLQSNSSVVQTFRHKGNPIDILESYLSSHKKHSCRWLNLIDIVVGSPLARYCSLPWQSSLSGRNSEWEVYAHAILSERGVNSKQFIRLNEAIYGEPRLMSMIDVNFLTELHCILSRYGWTLIDCLDVYSFNSVALRRYMSVNKQKNVLIIEEHIIHFFLKGEKTFSDIISLPIRSGQNLMDTILFAELLSERSVLDDYYWLASSNQQHLDLNKEFCIGYIHPFLTEINAHATSDKHP